MVTYTAPPAYPSQVPPPPLQPPPAGHIPEATAPPRLSTDLESGTPMDKESKESSWIFFFGGLILTLFVGLIALIPLCVFSELKENKKNRRAYLLGVVPLVTLQIIAVIAVIVWFAVAANRVVNVSSTFPSTSEISNTFPSSL